MKRTKVQKPTKITRRAHLYTEAEVAQLTTLQFHEAWVIKGPTGGYVADPTTSGVLTDYVEKKEHAHIYASYESAIVRLKTLDMCIKKGHTLTRFYLETQYFADLLE